MSKWREETATECGHTVSVHEDWDNVPRYCKSCKAERDARWYDGHASECGHAMKICRDWDKPPRFCKPCKEKNDAKWYYGHATECGHAIKICREWDNVPKYCKNCKAERDAKWSKVFATECGHETDMCRDWSNKPAFCKGCKEEFPPKERICSLCNTTFTISAKTQYRCRKQGYDLPKKCFDCQDGCKLIFGAFEVLRQSGKLPFALKLDIEFRQSFLSSSDGPVGVVRGKKNGDVVAQISLSGKADSSGAPGRRQVETHLAEGGFLHTSKPVGPTISKTEFSPTLDFRSLGIPKPDREVVVTKDKKTEETFETRRVPNIFHPAYDTKKK